MSFFDELKRRNVFRVGIAYLIAAWLVLQMVDVIGPMLGLPEWIGPTVLLLLAVGFVVSVFIAWAYEVTPEGIKRERDVDRTQSITPTTGRKLDFAIIGVLLLALIFFALDRFVWQVQEIEIEKSIAVIPFANRSADEADAYFVDGVHDDILTQLANLSGIDKVISRTSVEQYRDTEKTVPEIAAELGVATILEGGVQRAGDHIRINVQLIGANDAHLWAETYNRELTTENIFAIQSEIAIAIATELRATLKEEDSDNLTKLPTDSLAAWEKYQRGRYEMRDRSLDGFARARVYFEDAANLDENFALAYVGIADANNLEAVFGWGSGRSMEDFHNLVDRAQNAAERALEINPRLGEAYAALGYSEFNRFAPPNLLSADIYFRRAEELSPNYSDVYRWHAQILWERPLNRPMEALSMATRAAALGPLVSQNHVTLGEAFEINGRDGQAAASFERALEIAPRDEYAVSRHVRFLRRQNEYSRTIAAGLSALAQDAFSVEIMYEIARSYRQLGNIREYRYWADRTIESGHTIFAPAMGATIALENGLIESAIGEYSRAVQGTEEWELIYSLVRAFVQSRQTNALLELIETYAPTILSTADAAAWPPQMAMLIAPAAWALSEHGERDRAATLLDLGLEAARTDIRRAGFGYGIEIADIEMYVVNGDNNSALTTLTQAVADGYRNLEWIESSPFLDPIRPEPEFIEAMDVIREEMARQRAELEEMERNGELPPLPE